MVCVCVCFIDLLLSARCVCLSATDGAMFRDVEGTTTVTLLIACVGMIIK